MVGAMMGAMEAAPNINHASPDLLELFRTRRSIRRFRPDPVPPDLLDRVLEATRWAPTAGNLQAWRLMVLTDEVDRERVRRRPDDFLPTAPVVLVFLADGPASERRYGKRGATLYAVQDATIACTLAMLAAWEVGLGSCWVGAFDETRTGRNLGLPRDLRPVALLPLGWPAEAPALPHRRELADIRIRSGTGGTGQSSTN